MTIGSQTPTSHFDSRHAGLCGKRRWISAGACLSMVAAMVIAGCPDSSKRVEEAIALEAEPAPPPANPQPDPPRSPEQIVEDFEALPPVLRTDERLVELASIPSGIENITVLNLGGSAVTDGGAESLPHFTSLERLNLASSRVTGAALVHVAKVPTLTSLNLQHVALDPEQLAPLAGSDALCELDLSNTLIGEQAFEQLAPLEYLRILNVSGNQLLVGKGFSVRVAEGRFAALESLTASDTQFGFFGLEEARRLSHLRVLDIANAFVTNEALEDLKACRSLHVLNISNNKFTDVGLRHLAGLTELEELQLAGCVAVTDSGLNHLRRHTQLKFLNLDGTSCTQPAVSRLKEQFLKQTTIRHDGMEF